MPNPWFRLYSEFADDPKVQMMTEAMQRRLVMLMCSRCKGETLHETQMAFHWRISSAELADTKKVFLQNGFIDEDFELLNWNRRQFVSDSSTDRVRRSRQLKKQNETLHPQPTSDEIINDVTGGNVTVTAPEQIQKQNRTNSDSETEHKRPSARELAQAAAKRLSGAVNPEAHEDLEVWVDRIAVAYPKNRLKNLGPLEVYPADKPAIIDAILLEAGKGDVTPAEAAEMLLRMVEGLGDTVPREQWHMLPRMTSYFAEFEYRKDPETFKRKTSARGGARNGKSNNEDAFRGLLPEPIAPTSDSTVFAPPGGYAGARDDAASGGRLSGIPVGARDGGVDPNLHPSDGGVQVLPTPSFPARVQRASNDW